jgi:hypothetical protein
MRDGGVAASWFFRSRANVCPARRAGNLPSSTFSRGPTKEAHRRALHQPDGLLRSEAGQVRLRRGDPPKGMTACCRCAVSNARNGRLDLRFLEPRRVDLPITSRNGFVQHMPSRPVLAAHVSVPVCCIRSNPAALRQVEWPASQRQDYQTVATFRFRSEIGAPRESTARPQTGDRSGLLATQIGGHVVRPPQGWADVGRSPYL